MKGLIAAALMLGAVGCGAVDAAADCRNICQRYQSCYSATYDVDACEKNCNTNAGTSSTYRGRVDDCDACLDPKACTTAAFACGVQCSGIVP